MRKISIIVGILLCLCNVLLGQSPHGPKLTKDCIACHSSEGWKIPAKNWDKSKAPKPRISRTTGRKLFPENTTPVPRFDHDSTAFPLEGRHSQIDCRACHASLIFSDAEVNCFSCHKDVHQQSVGVDCKRCHNASSWQVNNVQQLHQAAGFPLINVHTNLQCASCHTADNPLRFERIGNECKDCHLKDFKASQNPNHTKLNLSLDCASCHTTKSPDWKPATFDQHNDIYPLLGAHAKIASNCAACHKGDYTHTPTTCAGCHMDNFRAALKPNHAQLNFPVSCEECHQQDSWSPSTFDHNKFYPFTGAHVPIANDCASCHHNNYANTPNTCAGCHTKQYESAQNPNHLKIGIGKDCATCHTTNPGWAPASFPIHDQFYPLTGAHSTIPNCAACHKGDYQNTPKTCSACHISNFEQAKNPDHTKLGISKNCDECHSTMAGWAPAKFTIHDQFYPLVGKHEVIKNNCAACHKDNNYSNTPNTCAACHNADFTAAKSPDHQAAKFPTTCESCHTPQGWSPSSFNHDQYYKLTGAHLTIKNNCAACHINGNYTTTPNTCAGCHGADFKSAQNPNHVDSQLPQTCETCHTTQSWSPSTFDHSKHYPLTGAHQAIANDCKKCHQAGNFTAAPTTCAGCHTNDYNGSVNPNHKTLGFSTDCAKCHTTTPGWAPASFPDHDKYYVLEGKHKTIANNCAACHKGNIYSNTPTTCAACHTADYTAAKKPDHQAAKFPTTCESCHTPQGWSPSSFNHDQYYKLTGTHLTIKDNCAACHINGNYTTTPNTCAGCHGADFKSAQSPNHVDSQLPQTCETCHSTQSWSPSTFDHSKHYPLTGAHQVIANDCKKCHQAGNFTAAPTTCAGCHTNDYNGSVNPNHKTLGFSTDCAKCHTTTPGWAPASFPDHDKYYVLEGKHKTIANNCAACHKGNSYSNTPTTCAACHSADYTAAKKPDHQAAKFPTNCESCHTPQGWSPSSFNHDQYYKLTGTHLTIKDNCAACHINGNYTTTPNTCAGCHGADFKGAQNPNHVDSQLPQTCETCHSTQSWSPSTFDHSKHYPLTGAHQVIANDCKKCHQAGNFTAAPTTCAGCHTNDYNSSVNPNHKTLGFSTDCAKCHTTTPGWAPASFPDHDKYYVLEGKHKTIANNCAACHKGNIYSNTPTTCAACHSADYASAKNPDHKVAKFPTTCESCHTPQGWSPSSFNHDQYYKLTGAHLTIKNNCASCHINGNYTTTPNTCAGCHGADFKSAQNPNHVDSQLPQTCETCHTTQSWSPSTFDHSKKYPLLGAHKVIANDCKKCHQAGNFSTAPITCAGCHSADYASAKKPDHQAAKLSTNCESCHSQQAWSPSSFNHDQYYPLTGTHLTIKNNCAACHINGNYTTTPNTCAGCHGADFKAALNPNHVDSQLPQTCETCHTTQSWSPSTFDHSKKYPLLGAHQVIANDCKKCHQAGNFSTAPITCAGCHNADYNSAKKPDHRAAKLSTNCESCHSQQAWSPSSFNHDQYYKLTGAHLTIKDNCAACHINGNYTTTPNTCAGCHGADFKAALNPNHVDAQLPQTCETCHTTQSWSPSTFDHSKHYPLTGAHQAIANDCKKCHQAGNFTNAPTTCAGCHTKDYNGSVNPNHKTLGFSTDCAQCHTTTPGWSPAAFPDHNKYFVLDGAHKTTPHGCVDCHKGNVYTNTPTTCAACHTADYTAAKNPDHNVAKFPTTCEKCHTSQGWSPSSFNHDQYYVLTGAHLTIKNNCAACHINGNYTTTPNTCAGCHTNDYNKSVNPNHKALGISTDCIHCHTTNPGWNPALFPDHDKYYLLQGAHKTIASNCVACHKNNNYSTTPNTCAGCHTADYAATTNPNHTTSGIPTGCADCHTQTAWIPSTFNHSTYYPLTGAHATIAYNCKSCHTNSTTFSNTPNTCAGCHAPDYQKAKSPDHVQFNFPMDCAVCHTTNPNWTPVTFNHNQYYPLKGAHATIANNCKACHNATYTNTPNTCYGCHKTDYDKAAKPNHLIAKFPQTCAECHTETAWSPSSFNHDQQYFPIYSGTHKQAWMTCTECHTNPSNFALYSCIDCHQHNNPTTLGAKHRGVNGYKYVSTACFECHPNGRTN